MVDTFSIIMYNKLYSRTALVPFPSILHIHIARYTYLHFAITS